MNPILSRMNSMLSHCHADASPRSSSCCTFDPHHHLSLRSQVIDSVDLEPGSLSTLSLTVCRFLMILPKERETVEEAYLGKEVVDAAIMVPERFHNGQHLLLSTRHASKILGMNVLSIINEPTSPVGWPMTLQARGAVPARTNRSPQAGRMQNSQKPPRPRTYQARAPQRP